MCSLVMNRKGSALPGIAQFNVAEQYIEATGRIAPASTRETGKALDNPGTPRRAAETGLPSRAQTPHETNLDANE